MTQGYYQTSNVNVPLNNRPKGEIAEIAITQLEAFQLRGRTWPTREVSRDGRHGMECSYCNQMIYFISDPNGILYEYADDELLALTVAHIRQKHERMVTHGIV
jgi:hypothetical protein